MGPSETSFNELSHDAVLYVIDTSVSMEDAGALTVALDAANWAIRDPSRTTSFRNNAGVILYNVAEEGSKSSAHVLMSLKEPRTNDLKRLIRLSKNRETFRNEFTPLKSHASSLIAAMKLAISELSQFNTTNLCRMVILTNDDNPVRDQQSESRAIALAAEITASSTFLTPIFLQTPHFDIRKFWLKINYLPPPTRTLSDSDDMYTNPQLLEPWTISALANSKHALASSKSRRKRVLYKGALVLGNFNIGIRGYAVVHEYTRPAPLKFAYGADQKTPHMLHTERIEVLTDTGHRIEQGEFEKKIKLGGGSAQTEQDWVVPISEKELTNLKTVPLPDGKCRDHSVIYVHSFAPASSVDLSGIIGHSIFITPGTDLFTNALTSFIALRQSMCRKNLVARVSFYPLHRAPVSGLLYAFSSANEPAPNTSSGMYFVHTPFSEEFRMPPKLSLVEMSPFMKNSVRKLCSKFTLPSGFNPSRFRNPLIESFAEILEYRALKIPIGSGVFRKKDGTRPKYDTISKTSYAVSKTIHSLLEGVDDSPKTHTSFKRPKTEIQLD